MTTQDGASAALQAAETFVFDFDGTLAPNLDLPQMRREVIALSEKTGVPRAEFEHLYMVEIIDSVYQTLRRATPYAAKRYRLRAHGLITEFEVAAAKRTVVFPATRSVLTELKEAGKRLAVVTRNCSQAVNLVFEDINDYCDAVLARDHVAHLKPDPRHVEKALDLLERPPHTAVMIGDGRMDMHVGNELGMSCIGVTSGSSNREELELAGAHLVMAGIHELPQHL